MNKKTFPIKTISKITIFIIFTVLGVMFFSHWHYMNSYKIIISDPEGEIIYYLLKPRSHLSNVLEYRDGDTTYFIIGSGIQERWEFDHWIYPYHGAEGVTSLMLVFNEDELIDAIGFTGIDFSESKLEYKKDFTAELDGSLNLEDKKIENIKLASRENNFKTEYYFLEICLADAEYDEIAKDLYLNTKKEFKDS